MKREKASVIRWGMLGLAHVLLASAFGAGEDSKVTPEMKSALTQKRAAFVENAGQWDKQALFSGRGNGVDMWVSKEGLRFDYYGREKDADKKFAGHVVDMRFVGGRAIQAKGLGFKGIRDTISEGKKGSRSNVYKSVRLDDVYSGVDLVTYFDKANPRYDFHVSPGANPSSIKLQFRGVKNVVASGRSLSFKTGIGTKRQTGLFAYQTVGGKKVEVPVSFKNINANTVKFVVGAYDSSKELVIDPLIYGTYYGGDAGVDEVRGVTSDNASGVYITGYTKSSQYPVIAGPYGFNLAGGRDAFVSKLQGDAYNHDYSALIGGSGEDQGNFIATDSFDNVWVCGSTTSTDFNPGGGAGRGWLLRFKQSGVSVLDPFEGNVSQIFRFGGTVLQTVNAMSVVKVQNPAPGSATTIRLIGATGGDLPEIAGPSTPAFYMTLTYNSGAFAVVPASSGYISTTSVAPNPITVTGLANDPQGGFVLSGTLRAGGNSNTTLANPIFTTTPGVWENGRLQRGNDIWVRRFAANGSLLWSGLLGGAASDVTEGFLRTRILAGPQQLPDVTGTTTAVDNDGNIYVLGRTTSFDFPRTRGVFGEVFDGARNFITVTKLNPGGTEITYSTHIRNGDFTTASGLAVDPRGNVYITGVLYGGNVFPDTAGDPNEPTATEIPPNIMPVGIPMVNPIKGAPTTLPSPELRTTEAWMLMLNPNATAVQVSTYIGGNLNEGVFAPYTDRFGDVWVFGWIDTGRRYVRSNIAGTTNNIREQVAGFPGGFITPLAFKENPDPAPPFMFAEPETVAYGGGPFVTGGQARGPGTIQIVFRRDGFLLRFRESLPLLTGFAIAPNRIPGGDPQGGQNPASTTGTLVLSAPAPAGGATIFLTLDNSAIASFEATSSVSSTQVNIPAGGTTVSFPIFGRQVLDIANVQVRADYAGNVRVAAFAVQPWLDALSLSTTSVVGGNQFTAVVDLLVPAPAGGVVVNVSTDRTDVLSFPGGNTVTVAAGARTATFPVDTAGVVTTQIPRVNVSLLGVTRTQTINVNAARLNRISFNPDTVAGGGSTTGTVILDGAAGADLPITLSVQGNPAGYSITPTVVTIPQNQRQATFTVQTAFEPANRTRIIEAVRLNGNTVVDGPVSGALAVQAVTVSTFTISPTTIDSGAVSVGTVTLSQPAPTGGAPVQIIIADTVVASAPAIVTVPAGQTTTTVNITGGFTINGAASTAVIAYRGPQPATGGNLTTFGISRTLNVRAVSYGLTLTPNDVFGGTNVAATLTLSANTPTALVVPITCDDATVGVPATVTVPANTRTVNFQVTTPDVTTTRTVNVSARVGTLPTVSSPLTIRAIDVISVRLSPNRVRQRTTTLLTVRTNAPVKVATVVTLSMSNRSLVESLPSITIPAGSSVGSVQIRANRVPRTLSSTITATSSPLVGGPSASATLTVIR